METRTDAETPFPEMSLRQKNASSSENEFAK